MNTFYNEILIDHNMHPLHKEKIEGANMSLEGVNPSCGDDIVIEMRVENDIIEDAGFTGSGCAISQASADIMIDMIIGKHRDQALHLCDLFIRMIQKDCTEEEIQELEEAGVLRDISHMPARVKCAVLSWHTVQEMFEI